MIGHRDAPIAAGYANAGSYMQIDPVNFQALPAMASIQNALLNKKVTALLDPFAISSGEIVSGGPCRSRNSDHQSLVDARMASRAAADASDAGRSRDWNVRNRG